LAFSPTITLSLSHNGQIAATMECDTPPDIKEEDDESKCNVADDVEKKKEHDQKMDFEISTKNLQTLKEKQQIKSNCVPHEDDPVPLQEGPDTEETFKAEVDVTLKAPAVATATAAVQADATLTIPKCKPTTTTESVQEENYSSAPAAVATAPVTAKPTSSEMTSASIGVGSAPSTPSRPHSHHASSNTSSSSGKNRHHSHHRRRMANIGVQCRRDKTISKHVGFGVSDGDVAAAAATASSQKYAGFSMANPCPPLSNSTKYKFGSLMRVETYPNGGGKTLHMWQHEISAASDALSNGCTETKENIETEIAKEFLKVRFRLNSHISVSFV
jgi:hypothetical protein